MILVIKDFVYHGVRRALWSEGEKENQEQVGGAVQEMIPDSEMLHGGHTDAGRRNLINGQHSSSFWMVHRMDATV